MSGDHDPRIIEGTLAMVALQQRRLDAGAGRLGWKAAFGSPSGRAALGLDGPLVGFLTEDRRLPPGATALVDGWTRPMLEAEVAVHIGSDLPPNPGMAAVQRAIAGLSAAIELADVDQPPSDVVEILRGNIFHRHVMVGELRAGRRDLTGVRATVSRNDAEVAATDDPEALTGHLLGVVTSMAATLAQVDERLLEGDVIITGAVVPPLEVQPGDRLTVALSGLGSLQVTIR
jgi:2-keto-4-pentenoate hydratase